MNRVAVGMARGNRTLPHRLRACRNVMPSERRSHMNGIAKAGPHSGSEPHHRPGGSRR